MGNIIKDNMKFSTPQEAADFIGYTISKRNDLIKKALAHYCEFEMLEDKSIVVTKAFDDVKPFRNIDYIYNIGDVLSNKFGSFEVIDRFIGKLYESMTKNVEYIN